MRVLATAWINMGSITDAERPGHVIGHHKTILVRAINRGGAMFVAPVDVAEIFRKLETRTAPRSVIDPLCTYVTQHGKA